jgi:pyruvate carboxylase
VAGGLAGLAGLAALGGAAAGGGYMLYRWINRTDTLAAPASALDSNAASVVGDNALFQESNVMQPNALFVDGV